ncbi:MAG: hypothetical protein Q4B85_06655 [Lachnospiraceae bacterium]|nr:hypothetical protein [Lachnospiraceae bacterium]
MKGIKVILYEPVQVGINPIGEPICEERPVEVENVLVGQPTEQDVKESLDLYGKKAVYCLGIPKKDYHKWEAGSRVEFFGEAFRIIGKPIKGIEQLVPGPWNLRVRVESYV